MKRTYAQIGPEKPMKDATEELVIPVLENMIKIGKVDDPLRCVLAIAARAVLRDKKLKSVQVLRTRTYLEFETEVRRYHNDQLTTAMITVFDLSGKFTAGEYRLMPMPPSAAFDAPKKEKKEQPKNGKKKRTLNRAKRMRPRGEHSVAWMQRAPEAEEKKT